MSFVGLARLLHAKGPMLQYAVEVILMVVGKVVSGQVVVRHVKLTVRPPSKLLLKEKYMNHRHADLDAAWNEYAKMVIPDDTGPTQIEETRRAFYAGAATVIGFMHDWATLDLDSKDGAAALESLSDQVEAFLKSIPECEEELCEDCRKGLH